MDVAAAGRATCLRQRRVQPSVVVLVVAEQIDNGLAAKSVRRPLDSAFSPRMDVAGKDDDIEFEIRCGFEGGELALAVLHPS